MKRFALVFIIIILLSSCNMKVTEDNQVANDWQNIREPAVAGQFYPGSKEGLTESVNNYLSIPQAGDHQDIKAILVPHAGYDFSAGVAAHAYKTLQGKKIGTAVIICNSHSSYFEGLAIDTSDAWQTPLGLVEVDKDLAKKN